MVHVDYEYYIEDYLQSASDVVPIELWDKYSRKAYMLINYRIFGKLTGMDALPEEVMLCICEVAETLYRAETIRDGAFDAGSAGMLKSYSNDGQSGTYDTAASSLTESGAEAKIVDLIHQYLAPTGLLYAGVITR